MKLRTIATATRHLVRAARSRTTVLLVAAALTIMGAGIRGLTTPSATVSETIGQMASVLAAGYVAAGLTVAAGAAFALRRVEVVGLAGLSAFSLMHGSLIISAASDAADLTALRIIAAAFTALALAAARWERGITRSDIARIDQIHTDLTGGEP